MKTPHGYENYDLYCDHDLHVIIPMFLLPDHVNNHVLHLVINVDHIPSCRYNDVYYPKNQKEKV